MKSSGALTQQVSWLFLEWRRFLQKRLVRYDITLQQLSVLNQLRAKQCLSPNEIADWLHCDRPTASVVIKNLEKRGWIAREREASNRKYHKIALAEAGLATLRLLDESLPLQEETPFDVLTDDENQLLYLLLQKCCDRMNQISHQKQSEVEQHERNIADD